MPRYKFNLFISLLFVFLLSQRITAEENDKGTYTLRGTVLSATDGLPASFALVKIEEHSIRTVCDIDGHFILNKVPPGEHKLEVNSLGFSPESRIIRVNKDLELVIKLAVSSIALPEFEVMAKKTQRDKLVVNESAIEYIQPTSLADVLLLLPGNVYQENDMSSFGQISSRQAGSDANTSLGVAVMTDGAPIVNDAMRTQMIGITDNSSSFSGDTEIKSRTGMNQGVDMRYISTDHTSVWNLPVASLQPNTETCPAD